MLAPLLAIAHHMPEAPKPAHWEARVFYQIFPRSFRDSNGDGHGDFEGIEDGLPMIQKLGCDAILLNPIQKSRVYHNYFADDFFDVDPKFGSLAEFDHMVAAAHQRGIKIVVDMEPQYIASGHPWYQAVEKDPHAPEAAYLATSIDESRKMKFNWYNHQQISLGRVQLRNPYVLGEMTRLFKFWADRGVDGFRIDHMMDDLDYQGKVNHLYADVWTPIENAVKQDHPDAFFVGEQADWESLRSPIEMFDGTPTDACFNFRLRDQILTFKKRLIEGGLREYWVASNKNRLLLNFIENHDVDRFASLETDPAKQRLAAALMILAKGSPILYSGQELGMRGEKGDWGSDGNDVPLRLAYRWGKTLDAPGTALWYKDSGPWWSPKYSHDHDGISLEEEEGDPHSLFNWYRDLIAIRQANPALRTGDQKVLVLDVPDVVAFEREGGGKKVTVVVNLSAHGSIVPAGTASGEDLISKHAVSGEIRLKPWQVLAIEAR